MNTVSDDAMTIDDELLVGIFKPERDGKVGNGALITKMLGADASMISYRLEVSRVYEKPYIVQDKHAVWTEGNETVKIIPDFVVTLHNLNADDSEIAFELENDIDWRFQETLRQIKKYQEKYSDTRIIIPKEYTRFSAFFRNEGFRVYLWEAVRIWQCLRCKKTTNQQGPFTPKCTCGNQNLREFRLSGLTDTKMEEST